MLDAAPLSRSLRALIKGSLATAAAASMLNEEVEKRDIPRTSFVFQILVCIRQNQDSFLSS